MKLPLVSTGLLLLLCSGHVLSQQSPSQAQSGGLSSKEQAWNILHTGASDKDWAKRAKVMQVLGLLKDDPEAEKMTINGLKDERAEVRAEAARSLGVMGDKKAIPELYNMYNDKEPSVIIAAAHSLIQLGDNRGYNAYYAILTGQSKTGTSFTEQQKKILKDPHKLAQIGFEGGIGFIPFAGLGYSAFKMIRKDDTSPVLAAAALTLADDPDPKSGDALADTAINKNQTWIVRAAALNALAKRGNPEYIKEAEAALNDEREEVQYSAAAAVIRLSDIASSGRAPAKPPAMNGKK